MITIPLNSTAKPPRQDPELWGEPLLSEATTPHDWCTVAQAQEHRNGWVPDSLFADIASGRITSAVTSKEEAEEVLRRGSNSGKER